MLQKHIRFGIFWLALAAAPAQIANAHPEVVRFPLPDGTSGASITRPNLLDDVAGTYFRQDGHSYGFLRSDNGSFTTIDVNSYNHHTTVDALDYLSDTVVGQYEDKTDPNIHHAFVRTPDGSIARFDGPGADDTFPSDVLGQSIVGHYHAADGIHGFLRSGRKLTTIDYPGATSTFVYAIDQYGWITGAYDDPSGRRHGFFRKADGTMKTVDPPGSVYTDDLTIVSLGRLKISGTYEDNTGALHGFVRVAGGKLYLFDQPFGRLNDYRYLAVGQTFRIHFHWLKFETEPVVTPEGCSNLFLAGINNPQLISGTMQCGADGAWFGYLTTEPDGQIRRKEQ